MDNLDQTWNNTESRHLLMRIARGLLHSPELAEEVVQEAYLRLLQSDISSVKNPLNWLSKVTRNLAIDQVRRGMRERELLLLVAGLHKTEQLHGRHAIESRLVELVSCLLHVSDSHHAAIVLLHDVFGLSYEDIATLCGRSPASCRQAGSRALRKCFIALEADEPYDKSPDTDLYVHAILDATAAPLIDNLSVASVVSQPTPAIEYLSPSYAVLPSQPGRTRQVIVQTPTGFQWALVLNGMLLCLLGSTATSSSETVSL